MQTDLHIPKGLPEGFQRTDACGLSEVEAQRRQGAGEDNRAKLDTGKSVAKIVASNLFTLFNLLNVLLAIALLAVGSYRNMLFMGVVISNTLIGTIQELRARRTIRKLQLLNAPTSHVLRDGIERDCAPEALVRGDLIVLRGGDQVLADAIVLTGSAAANEALLTGESDAVHKGEGDWLLSGSYITEGKCVAQLVYVGDESYVNRLAQSAREIKRPKSALMNDLNKLLRLVSIILTPLGIALFCKQYFIAKGVIDEVVPSTVAAMLGMIPEGLVLLTSVAMAVGVVKLGRRNALVQELYGIETLARADVLCLDKTGTLTTGEMRVEAIEEVDASEEEIKRALSSFLGAFDNASGTLDALRKLVPAGKEEPVALLPFSSARKKSAASFKDGKTIILGAPSFVLGKAYAGAIKALIEEKSAQGLRVLVLAKANGTIQGDETPEDVKAMGLLLLKDELRANVVDTLSYFRNQGVTLKVISGDDPRTVSEIARRVGLDGYDQWVDATTLKDDEALSAASEKCAVFGRVTPAQKQRIVEALKRSGHSVAMTGDGVNDIPAMKAADCSIAMAGGSDAAKHTAQLSLLDADFASMPMIVSEGRRVVNNIARAASLFLVKTLYSFALSVLLLLLPLNYPFQPIQLTLISTLTIGAPSFFLALEPNDERISGSFLKRVLSRAVPGAAAVALCACAAMSLDRYGYSRELCSTLATLSAGAVGLMVLARVCTPFNKLRAALLGVMGTGLVLAVALFGKLFLLVSLRGMQWAVLAGLIALGAATLFGVSALFKIKGQRKAQ